MARNKRERENGKESKKARERRKQDEERKKKKRRENQEMMKSHSDSGIEPKPEEKRFGAKENEKK